MRHVSFCRSYRCRGTSRRLHCEPLEDRRLLAITVDTLVDQLDGSIVDGDVSLRDAIALAAAGETIDFDASLDGGTILLTMHELSITKAMTIDATSLENGLTIDAAKKSRIFNIDDGNDGADSPVTIRGLTLTGGSAVGDGNAIRAAEGLTVTASTISGNMAGESFGSGGGGGGIWASGDLTVTSSTISWNTAESGGGGIWASGDVTVTSSTISANRAVSYSDGGGIWASGDVTITSSTISENSVGLFGVGSGIWASGDLTVTSSTISRNGAGPRGGTAGIYADGAVPVTIENSIVAGNTHSDFGTSSGELAVRNSLIGNNQGTSLAEAPVGLPDANGNLIGGPIHGVIDPMLAMLADNGGPTQTHALAIGSPAIDAGDPGFSGGPAFDQRGVPFVRVSGTRIDMGSYERQPVAVPPIDLIVDTLVDEMDADFGAGDLSLREAVFIANFRAGADTITFDPSLGSGTIALARGEVVIFDSLTIDATPLAAGITIDASGIGRIFNIDDGDDETDSPVTVRGLTLTGGHANGDGGAIRTAEDLAVTSSTISGNETDDYGGVGSGGGIWASGDLTVTSSTISGNTSGDGGGGIWASGDVTVTLSTISGNKNKTWRDGDGGGIMASGEVTVTIENSIVAGNTTSGTASDILSSTGTLAVRYSLIGDNQGTSLVEAPVGMSDAKGNLIGGPIHGVIDPMLAPLADNGGSTQTHPLAIDSPAIDAGDPGFSGGPAFDQRGVPFVRVFGARIDMGSYERQPVAVPQIDLIVDTLVDEIDADFGSGDLSLREAVFIANFRAGADTITFGSSLDSGTIALARGELVIFDAVTIDATPLAAGLAIDASGMSRIFNIDDGDDGTDSPVTVRGLTLTGGHADGDGGAIRTAEDLAVSFSTISRNTAWEGGGIWASGDVTVIASRISGNEPEWHGGGIWASGDVTVTASTISRNIARDGGGIWTSGDVTITASTISGNKARRSSGGDGGGIWASGEVTVISSTISENEAVFHGGGICASGDVTITSSTISGNKTWRDGDGGGGIMASGAVTLTIENSVVAGNTIAGTVSSDIHPSTGALAVRYSLIGDNRGTSLAEAPVGMPDANGNLIGGPIHGVIDPMLTMLADNGGPTGMHALAPGSPAIDAGDPSFSGGPAFDQRGVPFVRVSGARIDMGSYERQPVDVPQIDLIVDTLVDEIDADFGAGDLSLREAVFIANFRAGADTITFAPSLSGGTIALARGEVVIFDAVTIDATPLAASLTIDASGMSRIFNIDDGDDGTDSPVTVRGLTLTGGHADGDGGAIRTAEDVAVISSTIFGNETDEYGGVGKGGGIWASGDLTVSSSTISRNIGSTAGGIWASGEVTFSSSTMAGNRAAYNGGGIWASGDVTVTFGTISRNTAEGDGGGIWARSDVTVSSCTISRNASGDGGGGIWASGDVTVTSSTISGNESGWWGDSGGGGIWASGAVTMTIENSIVAGNTTYSTAPDIRPGTGTLAVRYSLIGANQGTGLAEAPVGMPDANGNLIGDQGGMGIIDPLLAPLADNGGPTGTHAVLSGSPAIDAGDPRFSQPPEFDQRGNPRVTDGDADGVSRIDMGAFELLRGDLNGDGYVNGLDVDRFVDVLLNGPSGAIADMNADGSVNGLDVDPFVAEVVGGTVSLGDVTHDGAGSGPDVGPFVPAALDGDTPTGIAQLSATQRGLPVGSAERDGVVAGSMVRQLNRRRPTHNSNHGDDLPRVIHSRTVQHAITRRSRMGIHVREDGQRSPPGTLGQDVQPETVDSWHGLVDRAMRDDTNWDRLR